MVLVIPNAYLVAIKGQSSGQDIVNVIGIEAQFQTPQNVAFEVASKWIAAGGPLSQHPSQYTMVEVTAMDLSSSTGGVYTQPSSGSGGITASLATNGACALVSFGPGSGSKSQKGRLYHGPLGETQINADGRTLASPTTIRTAYRQFQSQLSAINMHWGVISRKNSYITNFLDTNVNVESVIATQRRRIR